MLGSRGTASPSPPAAPAAAGSSIPGADWLARSLPALVLLATSLCYGAALANRFLLCWDDDIFITGNAITKNLSLDSLAAFFSRSYNSVYVPLTMATWALEYRLWGEAPLGFILTNILLHLANTYLVWLLVRQWTGRPRLALLTMLLFGVHPIHVESVVWITELKDVLYSLFLFLALWHWGRYLDATLDAGPPATRGRRASYASALVFHVLSLLSKGQAVVLPVLLLLLDHYRGRRISSAKPWLEKLPFFASSLAVGLLALRFQGMDPIQALASGEDLATRAMLSAQALVLYVAHLLLPSTLSAVYPLPPSLEQLPGTFKLALVLAAGLLAGTVVTLRRRSLYGLGLGFFLINLALVLDYFSLGNLLMTDRFAYVGSLGLFLVVGWSVERFRERAGRMRAVPALLLAAYVSFLGLQTIERSRTWRNDEALFTDAVAKYPVNPVAWTRLGCYYTQVGDGGKALESFDKAIRQSPGDPATYAYRGRLRASVFKEFDGALEDYLVALKLDPNNHVVLGDVGVVYSLLGKPELALLYYDRALAVAPTYAKAYANKGLLLLMLRRDAEARLNFEKARNLGQGIPADLAARLNLSSPKR